MLSRLARTVLAIAVLALTPAALRAQTIGGGANPTPDPGAATSESWPDATDLPQPDAASATRPDKTILDVPIEEIANSSDGCVVLDKDFPGLRDHPMYVFFKVMTLNQIAAMSHGEITPDMLAQAQTDLSALPPTPVTATLP